MISKVYTKDMEGNCLNHTIKIVNELLVELFNDILTTEKATLQSGSFSDLSVTEMHVIEAIGTQSRTMTDVAEQLGITVGTLTTSINRLLNKKYVTRDRSKEDRRFVQIALTERGEAAYYVHQAFHQEMVDHMVEELSTEDYEVLVKSLKRLSGFFKEKYHLTKR